jgi:hypothetical protein
MASEFMTRYQSDSPLYRAIVKECIRLDKPKHWSSDLEIDQRFLCARDNNLALLFAIGPNGTHHVFLQFANKTERDSYLTPHGPTREQWLDSIAHNFWKLNWYHWNGETLSPIDSIDARKLARKYDEV